MYRKLCGHSRAAKKEHMRTIRSIMRNLVRRYVTVEQRKAESQGVTEDDVNEIKQDISAFRCELIEILKNSGMNTSTASGLGAGSGGKKNRQKERRLMKGFNIAPTPGSGVPLAPVAEFIANLQVEPEIPHHQDLFGSAITGVLGPSNTLPKKSNQETPSSAPPYVHARSLETTITTHKPKFNISKRSSSRKRRWEMLMEAAKTGKVGKLINRSRSEDSVCNTKGVKNFNSPASDENQTESQTDSNPSLVEALGSGLSSLQSGLSNFGLGSSALAALKRKRKKFSTSRTKQCIKSDEKMTESTTSSGVYSLSNQAKNEKLLKRTSSVPARNPDATEAVNYVQFPEGESDSKNLEKENSVQSTEGDEQETFQSPMPSSTIEQNLPFKSRNGAATLPNLPGVQPVSGSQGWL
ncbi:hypothetical protein RUM44_005655 [Polyplax serrata]